MEQDWLPSRLTLMVFTRLLPLDVPRIFRVPVWKLITTSYIFKTRKVPVK